MITKKWQLPKQLSCCKPDCFAKEPVEKTVRLRELEYVQWLSRLLLVVLSCWYGDCFNLRFVSS